MTDFDPEALALKHRARGLPYAPKMKDVAAEAHALGVADGLRRAAEIALDARSSRNAGERAACTEIAARIMDCMKEATRD